MEKIMGKLYEFVILNPKETLPKGTISKKIAMDKLQPFTRDILGYDVEPYAGGTKFRNGDTIMARITPCLENGKIAQVNILDENEIGFGSTEYIVFRAKEEVTDPDYVYYLVCSSNIREVAIKSMVGSSGRQRVQTDVVQNIEIEMPIFDEQVKIASILKAFDDKIAVNNAINKNLEQQAQAIFKSWFVDFEPFGGNIPSDWKYGTVNDLAQKVVCGKTPSTKIPEYYGGDIPFITIPDMHNNTYTVITERYLSLLGAQSQQKKFLFKNSVCISCIGTAGLVTLVSKKSQTNQQINSIIPKNRYSSYYIYLLMQTLYETINKLGQSGSTIVNLNKTQFEKINVLVPSLESMFIFDQIVQPMFEMILANQLQNIELSTFRDVLLPKLMSGEIDISKVDN